MGPRSFDRGNLNDAAFVDQQRAALQWGRDLLIAEIKRIQWLHNTQYTLQWGRDLLIAEMHNALPCLVDMTASMGPRSFDRGNITNSCPSTLCQSRLQWGRDLLIAEMNTAIQSAAHRVVLQWGRDLLIAEIRTRCRRLDIYSCFNGAAIF